MSDITKLLGAIPSEYDPRDYTVRATVTVYPSTYALPDVPIYDQGKIGNCVMQALRSCPHAHYGKEMGATFGYGRWRDAYTTSSGMRPADACNGFVKEGIPLLTDDKEWLEMPDAQSYAQANAVRLLKAASPRIGWTWARCHTVDEIKTALIKNVRCIACLPYVGFDGEYWKVNGDIEGYHEMCIIGWDDSRGFRLRNSWGTGDSLVGVPKGGYVWVKYADIFACNDVIALAPPEAPDPVIRRTLRLNMPYMRGDDVREAQTKLNAHGFPCDTDGVFGKITDRAVKAFQTAKGLTADGIIGKNTWTALDAETEDKPDDTDIIKAVKAEFRAYLFDCLGDIYVWGGNGQTAITEDIIRAMENSTANADRAIKAWKAKQSNGQTNIRMFDCSGLISRWLQDRAIVTSKRNCNGLWAMSTPIALSAVQPYDLVFRGSDADKTHVGVYIGDGLVIEAKGRDDGVVLRGINCAGWTYAARLNCLTD